MATILDVINVRTSDNIGLDLDVAQLSMDDNGSREAAQVEFDLADPEMLFDFLPEDEFTISDIGPTGILFGGFARSVKTGPVAIGRNHHVIAYDYSTLLDRINVVSDDRAAGESDHDRLVYLMTTYASGLLDPDGAGIATLNADMPAQKFRMQTLRQAIEEVLGTALATGTYRINASKKLDTWDTASGLDTAPFNVVVGTPGVGAISPEDFLVGADSSNLYNAYWVRGATAAGSGWFTDAPSIAQWGRREKYIDAPDSDLSWKAANVGGAALADTAQPLYRGTFTAKSPYDGWRSNQRFLATSAANDLSAVAMDTVKVTTKYLSGDGKRAYSIAFSSPPASFAAKFGKDIRRSDGIGPGGGGWGPSGGFGGWGDGRSGAGEGDCGCPPWFDTCTPFRETFTRFYGPPGWGPSEFNGTNWEVVTNGGAASVNGSEGRFVVVGNTISTVYSSEKVVLPLAYPIHLRWMAKLMGPDDGQLGLWLSDADHESGVNHGLSVQMRYITGDTPGPYSLDVRLTIAGSSIAGASSYPLGAVDPLGQFLWVELIVDVDTFSVRSWLDPGVPPAYTVYGSPGAWSFPLPDQLEYTSYAGFATPAVTPDWRMAAIEFLCDLAPVSGQIIRDEFIAVGDGVRSSWFLLRPYAPNSPVLELDGVPQAPIQIDPTTGEIGLTFAPAVGEVLRAAEYQAA